MNTCKAKKLTNADFLSRIAHASGENDDDLTQTVFSKEGQNVSEPLTQKISKACQTEIYRTSDNENSGNDHDSSTTTSRNCTWEHVLNEWSSMNPSCMECSTTCDDTSVVIDVCKHKHTPHDGCSEVYCTNKVSAHSQCTLDNNTDATTNTILHGRYCEHEVDSVSHLLKANYDYDETEPMKVFENLTPIDEKKLVELQRQDPKLKE